MKLNIKASIRQKIKLGYYTFVAMVVGLSVVMLAQMEFMENKMLFGASVHEFLNTTLELRRFEKNYLLNEQYADYYENIRFVNHAQDLLTLKSKRFDIIAPQIQMRMIRKNLDLYREAMGQHIVHIKKPTYMMDASFESIKNMHEFRIRSLGDSITAAALDIEKSERAGLIQANNDTRRIVILSIVVLTVMAIIAGRLLSRIVLKPLERIENTMDEIAAGKFVAIRIDSHDQEVLSLAHAFNRMIRELELRQRHLVRSEKLASLGTLLSGVAHELNNPLSNISTSSQILSEEVESGTLEFKKELLAQINEQTDRARNIVRSLLEFSRTGDFKKQPLPLRDLLDETLRFVRGQVSKDVTITMDVPDDLQITADKQRIQQAFLNILKNAMEAVPGEGVISLSARKQHAVDKADDDAVITNYLKYSGKCTIEDDTVDIIIQDSGTGIPADVLPRIFDPFFSTKDVGKGSGLGLFIVHEIIEEHDGCIAVNSDPVNGTTFLVRLPVVKASE